MCVLCVSRCSPFGSPLTGCAWRVEDIAGGVATCVRAGGAEGERETCLREDATTGVEGELRRDALWRWGVSIAHLGTDNLVASRGILCVRRSTCLCSVAAAGLQADASKASAVLSCWETPSERK